MKCSTNVRLRRAFTLVELLVVIGIIALLVSILLPALNSARQAAASVVCQSNLRQVMQAIQLYANENHGIMPHTYGNMGDGTGLNGTYWTVQIAPYLGIQRGNDHGTYYHALERREPNALECPVPNPEALGRRYMTYGTLIRFHLGSGLPANTSPASNKYTRISKIRSPATKIIVRDISAEDWIYDYPYTWNERALFGKHGRIVPVTDLSGFYQSAYASFNAAFADGHVESILEADLGPTRYHALGGNSTPESVELHRRFYDTTLTN